MEKYNFFKQDALRPTEEQRLRTKLFYQNSVEIYAHYDDWKDIDKYYFTPLYMEMTYSCRWVAEMAPDPVWLGSFVRCTLEHPELFQYSCPECGKVVHPYRYAGSPLSGIVHLEGRCNCGGHGIKVVTGWRLRATAIRDQLASDKLRYRKYRLLHPRAKVTTVEELLEMLRQ
jgi:hypothetical protein